MHTDRIYTYRNTYTQTHAHTYRPTHRQTYTRTYIIIINSLTKLVVD